MDFHYPVCPTLSLDSYFVGNEVLLVTGGGRWWAPSGGSLERFPLSLPLTPWLFHPPSAICLSHVQPCHQQEFSSDLFSEGPKF